MAQNPVQMRSLFVGNIPKDLANPEEYLANAFGKFGLVLSVKLCRDINTQKSLGHAYVNFQNVADAERAQQNLNYSSIPEYPGRELRVAFSERDPNVRSRGKALFVKNIDTNLSNKALHELFSAYGTVIDVCQATDTKGQKLGFGTVQFADEAEADKAMAAMDGKEVEGKPLSVTVKVREEDKTFTKIFVRGIKADASDELIRVTLAQYAVPVGAVAALTINENPANNTRSAIIDLGDHDAAVKAVELLNDKKNDALSFGDSPLTVAPFRKPAERRVIAQSAFQNEGRNLYVRNLPDYSTEETVRALFAPFGPIESVFLKEAGNRFVGLAFVCFKKTADAEVAVARLSRHMIDGRPLYVAPAQHREHREQILAQQMAMLQSTMAAGGAVPPHMMPPLMGGVAPHHHMGMGPSPAGLGMGMPPHLMVPSYARGAAAAGMMGSVMGGPYAPFGPFAPQMGAMMPGPHHGMMAGPHHGHAHPRGAGGVPPAMGAMMMGGGRGFGGPRGAGGFANPRGPHGHMQQQQPHHHAGRGGRPNGHGHHQQHHHVAAPAPQQPQVTIASLEGKSEEEQKNFLGERLYNGVMEIDSERAAKITGMLLELPPIEVIAAINDVAVMRAKVAEAQSILAQHA